VIVWFIVFVLGAFCRHLSACNIALPWCITCGWCSLLAPNMWLVLPHQEPHFVNLSCCTTFKAHPCSSSYSYLYLGSWPFCNSCGSLFVPFSVRSPPRFPLVFFGVLWGSPLSLPCVLLVFSLLFVIGWPYLVVSMSSNLPEVAVILWDGARPNVTVFLVCLFCLL
jgi:hypothetical protein